MTMTDARRPVHLAVLVGASAGIYAISLAGVTVLQSSADQALMAERAPLESTIRGVAGGHDALDADLTRAAQDYGDAAGRYDRLAPGLSAMESALDDLAANVADVSGAARALPGHVALPVVTRTVTVAAKRPVTHGTTGASGG
jgi:hypothetical protein